MQKESSNSVRIFYPEFDREYLIRKISEGLPKLKERLLLKLVVLFGSYARGNHTVASDVDLLVVYKDTPREDAYSLVKKTLDLNRLEPHVYSLREYEEMKETIEKMIKGGVVLLVDDGGQVA